MIAANDSAGSNTGRKELKVHLVQGGWKTVRIVDDQYAPPHGGPAKIKTDPSCPGTIHQLAGRITTQKEDIQIAYSDKLFQNLFAQKIGFY